MDNVKHISSTALDLPREWFERELLDRFERYVRIDTASMRDNADKTPSTEGQWELARMLEQELRALGVEDVELTDDCFLIARLHPTHEMPSGADADKNGGAVPTIGLLAHLDTTEDFNGKGVVPQIHHGWDGKPISLSAQYVIDPIEYPALNRYKGETIITASGDTLLGADDKAGIAEIMTAVAYFMKNRNAPRPPMEIIFTPDEETGVGIHRFPYQQIDARYCYTMDGGTEGTFETECFNAYRVCVDIKGRAIHPGTARGRMVNAITAAAALIDMLPQAESPEATDGDYGFYCPLKITGDLSHAQVLFIIRDFKIEEVMRRIEVIRSCGRALTDLYPGCSVEITAAEQYLNLADGVRQQKELGEYIERAICDAGAVPTMVKMRGGTDGAQLTKQGLPTPNIFTGAENMHGRYEFVALPAMVRAAYTIIHLMRHWSRHKSDGSPFRQTE